MKLHVNLWFLIATTGIVAGTKVDGNAKNTINQQNVSKRSNQLWLVQWKLRLSSILSRYLFAAPHGTGK